MGLWAGFHDVVEVPPDVREAGHEVQFGFFDLSFLIADVGAQRIALDDAGARCANAFGEGFDLGALRFDHKLLAGTFLFKRFDVE